MGCRQFNNHRLRSDFHDLVRAGGAFRCRVGRRRLALQPAGLADFRAGQSHGRVSLSAQRVVLGIKNKKFRRAAARAIFPARIASQFHRFIFLIRCIDREAASGPAPVQFPDDVHVAFGDHALDGAVGGALDRQGDTSQVPLGVIHPHVARVSDEVGRIVEIKMIRENGGD